MIDKPLRVGSKSKVKRLHTYNDVAYDAGGWADVKKFLPIEYDLCLFRTKDTTYKGWNKGISWFGLNVPKGLDVLYWKKYPDYEQ